MDVTLGAALLAGLLSFLSPCVLPVVPAYLGQLGIVAAAKPAGFGTTSLASVGEIAVDGEAMRIRDTFQIEDPQGHELAKSAGSSRVWQWRPRTDSNRRRAP